MEDWIKNWLSEQRAAGKTCLEIKIIQNKPYVYHSPHDILTKFSAVYKYRITERDEMTEVPKKVRALAEKLNYRIFPN